MSELKYSKALKKQIILATIAVGMLIGIGYGLKPIDSTVDVIVIAIFGAAILFLIVPLIKKQANINCPHCSAELFEVLEATKFQKLVIKYCPCCGGDIEI